MRCCYNVGNALTFHHTKKLQRFFGVFCPVVNTGEYMGMYIKKNLYHIL